MIDLIRKLAAVENGRRVLERMTGPAEFNPTSIVRMQKHAAVEDPALLKVASSLAGDEDVLEMYELLGGKYKVAFGTPMFAPPPPQAAGAAGGSAANAPTPIAPTPKAPMPQAPMPQAPTPQAAQPGIGQVQSPSVPGATLGGNQQGSTPSP